MAREVTEAVDAYRKIKLEKPANNAVQEARLNDLGYALLRENKLAESIAIFTLNVEMYPKSSNVYDSLGEAYMKSGNKELAISNYRKSLELDPGNKKAADMLEKLR